MISVGKNNQQSDKPFDYRHEDLGSGLQARGHTAEELKELQQLGVEVNDATFEALAQQRLAITRLPKILSDN